MDRMLKQVRPLLGRTGYEAMTMRQVADATGKSTGTINYHFTNKQGLLLAVLDRELAALSSTDLDHLRRAIEAIERVSSNNDRFWLDMVSLSFADDAVAARIKGVTSGRRR